MNFSNLITELTNSILVIKVNRPNQLNALTRSTIEEIGKSISYALNSEEVKGIIITGSGEKAFVAGADIKEFSSFNREQGQSLSAFGHMVFKQIETCPKPVIAAVNGFALGGGCELAMACHIRIASETAKFSQPEVQLGIIPGYGGTQRLVQLIGKAKALELLLTGEMIDAHKAKQVGLVNEVVTLAELMPYTTKLMQKIISKSALTSKAILKSVNAYFDVQQNGYETETLEFGKCFETEDFKEGVNAFIEKRKPNFKNR